eukprot:TRINITY_DN15448_c0_g2_i1.p2 TRINITY_DN15448_c0_g2~~TRINITY_DN15448_c0_g2_i1.p2  ORF type:complete len:199 (-),score=41.19 TRINITY_DN15448_c0_g2_i1:181-777(-)
MTADGNKVAIVDWFLRCTSSSAMYGGVVLMSYFPSHAWSLYPACCSVLCAASMAHHAVDESLPMGMRGFTALSRAGRVMDAGCVAAASASFLACALFEDFLYQSAVVAVAGLLGACSALLKIMLFVLTVLAVAATQPDWVGIALVLSSQVVAAYFFVGMRRRGGNWGVASELWFWHVQQGIYLFCGARGLANAYAFGA